MLKEFIFILFISPIVVFAQTKTNLEVLYSLNDSLAKQIIAEIPDGQNQMILKLNLGESYSIFSNHIQNGIVKSGKEIINTPPHKLNLPEINIVMEEAGTDYGELDRNGWFGDYYVPRTIFIKGNYLNTSHQNGLQTFYIFSIDTVKVDGIEKLENDSFPFTKGKIPAEPFFSSLWEPVIAIGVAAVAVILFFSVRSQ